MLTVNIYFPVQFSRASFVLFVGTFGQIPDSVYLRERLRRAFYIRYHHQNSEVNFNLGIHMTWLGMW